MATTAFRLYLAGRLLLDGSAGRLQQEQLPGRQGRRALVYLARTRSQVAPRDALVAVLWPDEPPAAVDAALSAIISKLRSGLVGAGIPDPLVSAAGCYQLRLPPRTWIDIEYATTQLDRAEAALARGDVQDAWSAATVAYAILRRPLLPGDDSEWVRWQRQSLQQQMLRASDCLAEAWLHQGRGELTQQLAEDAIAVAPLREENHRLLMRAHLAQGNRSEALLTFHRCRTLLVDQLGVEPAPATEQVYRDALHQGDRP